MDDRLGIIGVGEIARAIVEGLCTGDAPPEVNLSPRGARVSAELASRYPSVRVCASNQEVADSSPLVIVAVRPDALDDVLAEVRMPPEALVVSAVAGASHDVLRRLGPDVTIVRVIPLPAVRRREGITAVFPGHPAVVTLFDRLGGTVEVTDGEAFGALSAATGTISAYLHYLAAVAGWVAKHGFGRAEADHYVRRVFRGVGAGLADSGRSLPELAADHETPGGLNEQLRRAWFDEPALGRALDGLFQTVTREP